MRLLEKVGVETIHEHDVRLSNLVRNGMRMDAGDSSMVSLELRSDFDPERLEGLLTAFRAGRLRAGFHLYNTEDDAQRLLEALRG